MPPLASGSLAVTTEVVHNLIDLLGAVAFLAGIRLDGRKSLRSPYLFIEAGITLRSTCIVKVEDAVQRIEYRFAARYRSPQLMAISEYFDEAPYFLLLILQRDGHQLV